MFDSYNNIVILTGSGISAESGVDTFRASNGLWAKHRIEDIATPEGFERNPQQVYEFYNQRYNQLTLPKIQPNAAHLALAELQASFSGNVTIITQNIDNLHERAGSKDVIHMHGELAKIRCSETQKVYPFKPLSIISVCDCCKKTGTLRPHIVWFSELPFSMDEIHSRLRKADLFIAIGTSGSVFPAASFVEEALKAGAHTIEVNLEQTHISSSFKEKRTGKATVEVSRLVEELLARDRSFF